ncbi:MAG TPA: hypothetical protein VIK91_07885 [Nannocystis sp.]
MKWLEWLLLPRDGPIAVLLAIIALCGLLGLARRRERGGAGAKGTPEGS